jgi:hypothetical protein
MRKRNFAYSFLCGILVFVAVLVLLFQALGVPFWWAFGIGNTQDGLWIISVSPENPRVGENVTIGVAEGVHNIFLIENATITITRNGMQPQTVYTDKDGVASFVYPGDATVIRASIQWSYSNYNVSRHSLYVVIPRTPLTWEADYWIAVSGAILSGLLAGIATSAIERKSWITSRTKETGAFQKRIVA